MYAKHLRTVDAGRTPSPVLSCWKSSVLIIGTDSWGKVDVTDFKSDITWSKFLARPDDCLNPVLQVRQVTPSASGGLCVTIADGFADTFTCEQTYEFDPQSGRHGVGCQIAAFESKGARASSPSGRYQVSFDAAVHGDEDYFRAAAGRHARGNRAHDASEFLGMTSAEEELVEMKVALSTRLRKTREQ